tara:strand:+ start:104 stop:568 length:465 start_codon:yes stop_codon:yes gene_type:complete
MKKLLITLLLISPFSFADREMDLSKLLDEIHHDPQKSADWGDVYYCQETTDRVISLEGETVNYTLNRFKFKLEKKLGVEGINLVMVFGKEGYFGNTTMWLDKHHSDLLIATNLEIEKWGAEGMGDRIYFSEGKFLYSSVGEDRILSISADCDKF